MTAIIGELLPAAAGPRGLPRRKCLIRKVPHAGLGAGFLARSLLGETVVAFPDLAVNSNCIMLVGADPIRSRVLTRTLRRRDFQVASVRDGGAALRLAGAEEPAYVILDQDLPDRSGLALIRPLRSALPESRILVLAASPTIESAVDSIKLGACNYLAIPAGVDEILRGLGAPDRAQRSLEIEATIGEGGMGVVRLGTQLALSRKVAVKTVRDDQRGEAATMKILREAWVTGSLEHPNVVPVYELGLEADGSPVIVMKRIEGVSLHALLRGWGNKAIACELRVSLRQAERILGSIGHKWGVESPRAVVVHYLQATFGPGDLF